MQQVVDRQSENNNAIHNISQKMFTNSHNQIYGTLVNKQRKIGAGPEFWATFHTTGGHHAVFATYSSLLNFVVRKKQK